MSKFTELSEELHAYIVERGSREDEALAAVREETAALGDIAVMQIAPDQGALMTMLDAADRRPPCDRGRHLHGLFRRMVSPAVSGEGGELVCCELDPERAKTAFAQLRARRRRRADRGPRRPGRRDARRDGRRSEQGDDPYDLAFIDADKQGYDGYYESCLQLLRPGGLVILDNVLQDGRVLDPSSSDDAAAIDELNRKVRDDDRVEIAMIGVADGLTLIRKK